jgi:type II secretion system protein G
MKLIRGFTLIELLVVIAIIGILAAIIFPVYSRVKDSAYRSSDMTNMNSLRTALQLYRTDQGAYPPALLGYVTMYTEGPNTGNIVPANLLQGALYPKRVDSIDTFRPAYLRISNPYTTTTTAHWPTGNVNGGAGQPLQRFGPSTEVEGCVNLSDTKNLYYEVSGYDVATVQGSAEPELHYTLFWTGWTVPADPCNPNSSQLSGAGESGSSSDNPNQLGYSDPPETTVITWDSFFRDYDANGNPESSGKRDLMLFLGGAAKPMDSLYVSKNAWASSP